MIVEFWIKGMIVVGVEGGPVNVDIMGAAMEV
jgi:hypothetical protein